MQQQITPEDRSNTWENYISLNNSMERKFTVVEPAAAHEATSPGKAEWDGLDYAHALARDGFVLPQTEDREGYYGTDHFSYWASGLKDARLLLEMAGKLELSSPKAYLDFGCASGRVTRHVALERPDIKIWGCDINRQHVEWCNAYLPPSVATFQNTSIPTLPLESNSVDIVSAFSVFTHIEAMETSWIMELRRILRPGGIAWITVHTEGTMRDLAPEWPLWAPVMQHPAAGQSFDPETRTFDASRLVLRWHNDRSYSSNVFYREAYLRERWGRLMEVAGFYRRLPSYQDVIILRKE